MDDEDNLYVRVSKDNIPGSLAYIRKTYLGFDPGATFEYHFLDENFANHYESEKTQGSLILVFTVLAIFISCLGLFGLVTFNAEQRIKEIGVRKVLGASVTSIVRLLLRGSDQVSLSGHRYCYSHRLVCPACLAGKFRLSDKDQPPGICLCRDAGGADRACHHGDTGHSRGPWPTR